MKKSSAKLIHRLVVPLYVIWLGFFSLVIVAFLFTLEDRKQTFALLLYDCLLVLASFTVRDIYYTEFYWRYFPELKSSKKLQKRWWL